MVRFKLVFVITAILLAVGGAFATRPNVGCEDQPQYFKWGSVYVPAGQYGVDYTCISSVGICTYFRPSPTQPNGYVPCKTGSFSFIY